MPTGKVRRHSGRTTPKVVCPQMKYSDILKDGLEPKERYSDWNNYRDSFRQIDLIQWKRADKNKKKWQHYQKRFYRMEKRVIYGTNNFETSGFIKLQ